MNTLINQYAEVPGYYLHNHLIKCVEINREMIIFNVFHPNDIGKGKLIYDFYINPYDI